MLLASVFSAQAGVTFETRVPAKGVKALSTSEVPPVEVPPVAAAFATGVAGAIYSNGNTTVARTPGGTLEVPFANSKATGKWYYEMQSTAQGSPFFKNTSGSGYFLDLYYRGKSTVGPGISSDSDTSLRSSPTARYGFAFDVDAKKLTIFDVTTCSVVTNVWWTTTGAVRPQIGYRAVDASTSAITAYFAPSGKTCIPAGYRWWTGD